MEKMLREIRERVLKNIEEAKASSSLEQIRVGALGKKGELTGLLRGMGKLPPEERPKMGQLVNDVRAALEAKLEERAAELAEREKQARLAAETIDVTLPGPERGAGSLHPMNIVLSKMVDIFVGMGYEVVDGPEVEYDHYNFELLNVPKNHPARDAQDTFYVEDNIVLRSQTSPVQARVMTTRKPPIRIISPGRVYRADEADATHSPVFHQMEGLVIDENITMGDLKGTLDEFARQMFGEGIKALRRGGPDLRQLQGRGLPHVQGHRLDRGAGRRHGEPEGAGDVRHRFHEVFRLRLRHGRGAHDASEVQHPEPAVPV